MGCLYLIISILIVLYIAFGVLLAGHMVRFEDERISRMTRMGLLHPRDTLYTTKDYAKAIFCWPWLLISE